MPFKFNPFKRNLIKGKRKGRPEVHEVASLNAHTRFVQRQRVYLRDKERMLSDLGLEKRDVSLALEFSRFGAAGQAVQQTSVVSKKAGKKILVFFQKHREELIDNFAHQFRTEKNPQAVAIRTVTMFEDMAKESFKRASSAKGFYNEGAVQRADVALFGKISDTKHIVFPRLLLASLPYFETEFLQRKGINLKQFESKDSEIRKSAFGEGKEILI